MAKVYYLRYFRCRNSRNCFQIRFSSIQISADFCIYIILDEKISTAEDLIIQNLFTNLIFNFLSETCKSYHIIPFGLHLLICLVFLIVPKFLFQNYQLIHFLILIKLLYQRYRTIPCFP